MKNMKELRIEEYGNEKGWNPSKILAAEKYFRLINENENFTENNKLNDEDIKEIIRKSFSSSEKNTTSYGTLQVKANLLREVLEFMGVKAEVDTSKMKELVSSEIDGFYTQKEIISICNTFENPQDKFIVYALFMGINGKEYEDICTLKETDIDFEDKSIKLSNKTIPMDEYLEEVLRDALDKEFGMIYYKIIDKESTMRTVDYYDLNPECAYVIKPKPYSKNNNGMDHMKKSGLRARLKTLSDASGFRLTPNNIERSGVMHKMNNIGKDDWTNSEVKSFLKYCGVRSNYIELLRLYKIKYKK
jgi:hypothetical protein